MVGDVPNKWARAAFTSNPSRAKLTSPFVDTRADILGSIADISGKGNAIVGNADGNPAL